MAAVGVGPGFCRWAGLLMDGTASSAVVNGFWSSRVRIRDGVRQGCPLAPLLYLFVGLALHCWLQSQGFGVEIPGGTLTTSQFADDAHVPLTGRPQVQPFRAAMAVFAAASGQRLNESKVELAPLGLAAVPPPPPPQPPEPPPNPRAYVAAELQRRRGLAEQQRQLAVER